MVSCRIRKQIAPYSAVFQSCPLHSCIHFWRHAIHARSHFHVTFIFGGTPSMHALITTLQSFLAARHCTIVLCFKDAHCILAFIFGGTPSMHALTSTLHSFSAARHPCTLSLPRCIHFWRHAIHIYKNIHMYIYIYIHM